MTLYVNNSLLTMLCRCQTETWIRWGRELVAKEQQGPGPREVGTVLHAAFEAWFKGASKLQVLSVFADVWVKTIGDALPGADRLQRQNVSLVLYHWLDQMALKPHDWTVIATEQIFEVPLGIVNGEDIIYYGTPDVLIEWKGDLYVVDNKSTGSIDADWASSWQMSSQLQSYVWAYRQLGHNVKGAFVNGLEVSKLPPWDGNMQKKCSVHKTKYAECQRAHVRHQWVGPIWFSHERLEQWKRDALQMVTRLQAIQAESQIGKLSVMMDGQFRWPGCVGSRGRPSCQYLSWCQASRPLSNLHQMMIHADWRGPLKEGTIE